MQQVYGSPDYVGGIQSALLNSDATVFRRRYFNNGAHMGFILYSTDPDLHSESTRYYCACKNPLCGHRFVMNMEFGHTTRASKLTKDKLLELVLGKLSDEEKANLRKILDDEKSR